METSADTRSATTITHLITGHAHHTGYGRYGTECPHCDQIATVEKRWNETKHLAARRAVREHLETLGYPRYDADQLANRRRHGYNV